MKYWTVTSFTGKIFKGRPSGVFFLDSPCEKNKMQEVAAHFNQLSTCFIAPKANKRFDISFFSPHKQLPFCPYALISGAHILSTEYKSEMDYHSDSFYFDSDCGVLKVKKEDVFLSMDFQASSISNMKTPVGLIDALGVLPVSLSKAGENACVVELRSWGEVIATQKIDWEKFYAPNLKRLIITSECSKKSEYDFISRSFSPNSRVTEREGSGLDYCHLAPYWAEKLSKNTLKAYQASERGGATDLHYENKRVSIKGDAITLFSGMLKI